MILGVRLQYAYQSHYAFVEAEDETPLALNSEYEL